MNFEPHLVYHIYNQGNNGQPIFFQERNYLFFLQKMRTHILPYADFLAYCLMPNHFHWLVYIRPEACEYITSTKAELNQSRWIPPQQLAHSIGIVLRSYTQAINKQENRKGALFRLHTKAKNGVVEEVLTINGPKKHLFFRLDNDYIWQCFHYIHHNPVSANLVAAPEDWLYSSARDYAQLRKGTLCNQQLARELLPMLAQTATE